jgi:hypothetical protein
MRTWLVVALVLIHARVSVSQAVTSFSFAISLADRVAGRTNSAATFTFTVPSQLSLNGDIFIQYPNNFFADGVTPTASLSGGKTCTPTATGATNDQVACMNVNAAISASTVVVLTLTGLKMGPVTAGDCSAGISITKMANVQLTGAQVPREA